jgi:hypothetical protein
LYISGKSIDYSLRTKMNFGMVSTESCICSGRDMTDVSLKQLWKKKEKRIIQKVVFCSGRDLTDASLKQLHIGRDEKKEHYPRKLYFAAAET